MKISHYHHVAKDEDIFPDQSIILSTRTSSLIKLKNEHWDALLNNNLDSVPDNVLKKVIEYEILVNDNDDELSDILNENIATTADKDKKHLSYTIQPSAFCQLGCHYCGQQHVKKSMGNEVINEIFNRLETTINNIDTLQSLHVNWYGGEPLTGLSAIRELSPKILSLCKERNIHYSAHIVTNALNLKFELYKELVEVHKIGSFQITIDGDEEYHDKRRMLKNNSPSFSIIYGNIKEIVHSDFYKRGNGTINLRCNVDAENKENIPLFIDKLHNDQILDKITFYISPIHDWGDVKGTKVNGISKEDFADFEIDMYLKLMDYKSLESKKIIPTRTTTPCMVVSKTSEVFDAYGNVSTCWEVPYTPYYDDSGYYSGNLTKDKNVDSSNAPMRNWFKEIPTNSSWCKSCKFLPMCGGACPKNWYEGTPACPSFKFNIDDRIFLKFYDTYK